jgi:hypothetical protein
MGEASIESDGIDVFVVYNGVRIAKRGQPNSPQAGTWVSLEAGFRESFYENRLHIGARAAAAPKQRSHAFKEADWVRRLPPTLLSGRKTL